MKQFSLSVFGALALIVALVVVKECGYRQGEKEARAQQVDVSTDLAIKLLQREAADSQKAFAQRLDSTQNVIARLRSRIPRAQPDTTGRVGESLSNDVQSPSGCAGAPVQCDSLIAAYEAGRQSDSLQLLFWQGAVSQRDSIIVSLQQARNQWRARSQQPRHTLTDIGGGAIAGWGLAENNEPAILAGLGLVVVPRLLGSIRGLFGS